LAYRACLSRFFGRAPEPVPDRMELACPPGPLLRASASFFGLALRRVGKIGCATANGAPDVELATNDQKKRRLRVRRRQNLAALGYGRAHAHSILSIALREFCNEIRLYGDWRWEP